MITADAWHRRAMQGAAVAVGLFAASCVSGASSGNADRAAGTGVALQRVFEGAALDAPVHMAPLPGRPGELVVVEQGGTIRRFTSATDGSGVVFLDIAEQVYAGGERGLLSIAFHPDFARNRRAYVYYSVDAPHRSRVAEFQANQAATALQPGTERVLLELEQPYGNHNGGQLAFGPDGMLYVALGDGGSGGDPLGSGQNPATLLGSILRIDVDSQDEGLEYAIPPDNPFADGEGGAPEVWAYGLRNPWRFSFDAETGQLWAGDVGQNAWEEIDRIERGGNYGWNVMEGDHCYSPSSGCDESGLERPVTEYDHSAGRSVTGGFVYRGGAIAGLRGHYVFGDYSSGTIWTVPADAEPVTPRQTLLETSLRISSFGQDADGELYVVDRGGAVHKLVPAP